MELALSSQKTIDMLEERIGVWWDINTCPVPKGIDFHSVRSRIERALHRRCGYNPIVIFCVGDLERIAPRVLKGLSSSGILLRHVPCFGWSSLCDHLREWKSRNLIMSRILLISGDISWFTGPWFHSSILSLRFKILRAYPAPRPPGYHSWKEWVWEELLLEAKNPETNSQIIPPKDEHVSFCTLCELPSKSCDEFIDHLNSTEHMVEFANSMLVFVDENNDVINHCKLVDYSIWTSEDLSQNMSCLSMDVFSKRRLVRRSNIPRDKTIGVWWDINTCPLPDSYEPGLVRPSIESALKKYTGHACPVTIFCVGNLEFISPKILRRISSSGIILRHTIWRGSSVSNLLSKWREPNPPPAKIMLISADGTWFNFSFFSIGYTIFRTLPDPQSFPSCTSTHAWAWESLLEENSSSLPRSLLEETISSRNNDFDSWFCTVCDIPSQSCDDFISHLKSKSHSEQLWDMVPVDNNNKTPFFCKLCNYPGYDHHNLKIHLSSENMHRRGGIA